MHKPTLLALAFLIITSKVLHAQMSEDSTIEQLQALPVKYITGIDKKIDRYTNQIKSKTERSLTKLSRWENKIHILLLKANPQAAEKLFNNNQLTFTAMLQKLKQGEEVASQYQVQYDSYRDKLTIDLKYLRSQKENINTNLLNPLDKASEKIHKLNEEEDRSAALQEMIKERKKLLINESIQFIGNSKYLAKINKESFYYIETLRNYKDIFNDPAKTEMLAKNILNRIPAFQQFFQKNSMLASLFGAPENSGNSACLAGLQTRASVQSLVQDRLGPGGPNVMQQMQQNIQVAQTEIIKLKNKLLSSVRGNSADNLPDFKPNMEKTKTLKQRIEIGSNFQFEKSNTLLPAVADIGLSVGYRINEKSVAGIGASYKMGMGKVDHLQLSNLGASFRSFLDWKLKKQFFLSGGIETNYQVKMTTVFLTSTIRNNTSFMAWRQSALLGISKKIGIKTKWSKETKMQLLYDFLSYRNSLSSQPVIFRIGYNF